MQPPGVVGTGPGEPFEDARPFHHLAAPHHDGPVGDIGHHTQIVCDQQDSDVGAIAQAAQQRQDRRLLTGVEGRRRFVGHQQRRIGRHRERDGRPLPVAGGQLPRVGIDVPLRVRKVHQIKKIQRPGTAVAPRHIAEGTQHLAELRADGEPRVEGGPWIAQQQRRRRIGR